MINLSQNWHLTWCNFQKTPNKELLTGNVKDWLKATVPGDVHLDLFFAGLIPDPYFGLNADLCRWIEEKDWYYRTDFVAPRLSISQKIFLIFEGIDTFATIFLNGEEIARNKNMFTSIKVDITEKIKKGKNKLAVKIASPVFSVELKDKSLSDWYLPRLYARKAQFNYGWDIAPHLVSIGIWKPVYLKIVKKAIISDLYIQTISWDKKTAFLKAEIEIETYQENIQAVLILKIFSPEQKKLREITRKFSTRKPQKKKIVIYFDLSPFELWWPNGFGKQSLYQASLSLEQGSELINQREQSFGIKNVRLVQERISRKERSFYFRINGKRIFIKGFNWTPADTFPGTIKPEKYRFLLKMIKETGANMLRVWGGGIYEPEIFYQICSELGIMVWQDFMFACGSYPDDKEFLKEVKEEAKQIVQRLRKHPCLALWSGGNENDCTGKKHKIGWGVLSQICKNLDPNTPYIPDSPFDPLKKEANCNLRGDSHRWAHGKSYKDKFYLKDKSKFVSEIGHISVPDIKTLSSFLPKNKLWPPFNEYWYYHSSDTLKVGWKNRINSLFESIRNNGLPEPKNLEQLIKTTQDLQAKAYQTWTNYYYHEANCGGILLWNLYDCWPQISDSIISYNLKPKKAYYAVKETFLKLK